MRIILFGILFCLGCSGGQPSPTIHVNQPVFTVAHATVAEPASQPRPLFIDLEDVFAEYPNDAKAWQTKYLNKTFEAVVYPTDASSNPESKTSFIIAQLHPPGEITRSSLKDFGRELNKSSTSGTIKFVYLQYKAGEYGYDWGKKIKATFTISSSPRDFIYLDVDLLRLDAAK